MSRYIASALILIQCLIFGFSFIATKEILGTSFPVFLLLGARFLMGGVFLSIIGICSGKIKAIGKQEIVGGSISGVLLFGAFVLQTCGLKLTTPAKSGLYTDLFVIFVPMIKMLITKKINHRVIWAAILAFSGTFFLSNVLKESISFSLGDILCVACGLVFAIQFLVIEKYAMNKNAGEEINAFTFTIVQLFFISILSIGFSLLLDLDQYSDIQWKSSVLGIVYLGILASGIAFLLQFYAQSRISAESTAVLSCSEAMFTLLFSLIFAYDTLSVNLVVGSVLLLIGMILAAFPEKVLN